MNIYSFRSLYRGLIKFQILFIYLWKPQSIILNILPEWLGKSQENFHTFYSGLIYPVMVLNLLPSKDNLSKNTEQVFTLWSFSALLGLFWFEDSLSQDCEQVEETHTEDATPETDDSDENWLKNEIESHTVYWRLSTMHWLTWKSILLKNDSASSNSSVEL